MATCLNITSQGRRSKDTAKGLPPTPERPCQLRAHHSAFDRVDALTNAAIPDDAWTAAIALLRQAMAHPDSCRVQSIR